MISHAHAQAIKESLPARRRKLMLGYLASNPQRKQRKRHLSLERDLTLLEVYEVAHRSANNAQEKQK